MRSPLSRHSSRSGHDVVLTLAAFPVACFSGAFLTDIAYAATADMIWADFSAWLLALGIAIGVLAAIAAFVNVVMHSPVRGHWLRSPLAVGSVLVLVLALFDNLVHSRDAWTSVMPAGLILSAITVIAMIATGLLGAVTRRRLPAELAYAGANR